MIKNSKLNSAYSIFAPNCKRLSIHTFFDIWLAHHGVISGLCFYLSIISFLNGKEMTSSISYYAMCERILVFVILGNYRQLYYFRTFLEHMIHTYLNTKLVRMVIKVTLFTSQKSLCNAVDLCDSVGGWSKKRLGS